MTALLDPVTIRATNTAALREACGGVSSYLVHVTREVVDHELAPSVPPVYYPVFAQAKEIHQIETPGGEEKITTELVIASADTVPNVIDLHPGTEWAYMDTTGEQFALALVRPICPVVGYAVAYELEVRR